jgi:hypothetical protein
METSEIASSLMLKTLQTLGNLHLSEMFLTMNLSPDGTAETAIAKSSSLNSRGVAEAADLPTRARLSPDFV